MLSMMKTFVENTALPAGSLSQEGPSERPESHPPFCTHQEANAEPLQYLLYGTRMWSFVRAELCCLYFSWPGDLAQVGKGGLGDALGTGMFLMQLWREIGIKSWEGLKMGVPHSCALKHLFHTHRVHWSTYLYFKWMSSVCLMLKSDESECPCNMQEEGKKIM